MLPVELREHALGHIATSVALFQDSVVGVDMLWIDVRQANISLFVVGERFLPSGVRDIGDVVTSIQEGNWIPVNITVDSHSTDHSCLSVAAGAHKSASAVIMGTANDLV